MPAPDTVEVKDLFASAEDKTRNYEWMPAANLYQKIIDQSGLNRESLPDVIERLAQCYYKAAFQSRSRPEFVQRMKLAEEMFGKSAEMLGETAGDALSKRATAKKLFARFWLEESSEIRRKLVEKCVSLSVETAQLLQSHGRLAHLAQVRLDLLRYSREAVHLAREWKDQWNEYERTVELGRVTITQFESLDDVIGQAEALHYTVWMLAVEAEVLLEPPRFKELAGEAIELGEKLTALSRRIGTPYVLFLANEAAGDIAWDFDTDPYKAYAFYEAALTSARKTDDSLAIGRILAVLTTLQEWMAMTGQHSEERRESVEKGLGFAKEGIDLLRIPLHTSYLARTYSERAGCYINLANLVETDPVKKRVQLEKASDAARRGMTCEKHTLEWYGCAHEVSRTTYFLAVATVDPKLKSKLLQDALAVREETIRVTDILQPYSWNRGVNRNYLALIKAELADMQQDGEVRSRLLEEAVSHMQECLDICGRWAATVPGSASRLARYSEWYGDILHKLYRIKQEPKIAQSGAKAYRDAIEYLSKHEQIGPVPTIRWKIAKLLDALGQFQQAAQAFEMAAEEYRTAAGKVPGTGSAFHELATYMDGWAEIENAQLHHEEEAYRLAFEAYTRAARKLSTTEPWHFLSNICTARSLLEKTEELSREERHGAAIDSLVSAVKGFREAKSELEARLKETSGDTEAHELQDWLRHTSQRETYSLARIDLEEAKAAEKKGHKTTSSKKYQSASEILKGLATETRNPQDRGEIVTLAQFCYSWSKMKSAESSLSPDLFVEAAQSFMKVQETTTRQTPRLLALANASICRALESGTRFRLTRDPQHYSEIKRHLETAADYYNEAGFKKTANWTRATQKLFDALIFSGDAETERDPRKKAQLFHLAETHFELSAKLYGEAGFPRKKEETLQELERTREEREALLAPLEVLAEIPTTSIARLTSIPPNRSPPPGLGRFEDAYLGGEIRTPSSDVVFGSDFTVNLDMVNVGKTAATLIRLENIVPEGFEHVPEKGQPELEGNSFDLRGRRLEYLKTHMVSISLRTVRKGTFDLGPRVIFVDEKGNYRSHEFKPRVLTVREPGLSEGVQAPPSVSVPPEFRFENERSREVFRHMIKKFLDDHMSKRIVVEKAGWRSLMEVIRDLRIPRSALYGPKGRTGPALAELERRGLVETRIFPKERGRGGEIKKVRVAIENTIVKRIIDRAVMENA